MVNRKRGRRGETETETEKLKVEEEEGGDKYEESRAQRIKENKERMKSLGIPDLSNQLKRQPKPAKSASLRKPKPAKSAATSTDPPRRSSRFKDVPRVNYSEKKIPKKDSPTSKVEIHIPEGENPEIYTDDHDKLLGDSIDAWTLYVDGFDEDGQRMYDPLGTSCHQCRQKTLGQHTNCSKCNTGIGQFCGDCLWMRYGENVTEVKLNQEWICPACRGICNCSRCRRDKGWNPTGAIYRKVVKLGFKSVAHYLICTRREGAIVEPEAAESSDTVDEKEGLSDAHPESGAKEPVIDDENEGDDHEHEDDEDDDSGSPSNES